MKSHYSDKMQTSTPSWVFRIVQPNSFFQRRKVQVHVYRVYLAESIDGLSRWWIPPEVEVGSFSVKSTNNLWVF